MERELTDELLTQLEGEIYINNLQISFIPAIILADLISQIKCSFDYNEFYVIDYIKYHKNFLFNPKFIFKLLIKNDNGNQFDSFGIEGKIITGRWVYTPHLLETYDKF